MKKLLGYVCNSCGYVYSKEDAQERMDISTKHKDKCCVDGCLGFNLKPVIIQE